MVLHQYGVAVRGILITFAFTLTLSERGSMDCVNIKKPGKYALLNMAIV